MCGAGNARREPAPHCEPPATQPSQRSGHDPQRLSRGTATVAHLASLRRNSRFASALRLLTLIVVTSLVVGGIAAGQFIGLLDQLTTATR
jgi:hypothetical protein